MSRSLQLSGCSTTSTRNGIVNLYNYDHRHFLQASTTSFLALRGTNFVNLKIKKEHRVFRFRVNAATSNSNFKMNLNEYLVTLDKPLGIRFALAFDGNILVHSLKKGGNGEKSRIIMVGDTLKKVGRSSDGRLGVVNDLDDIMEMLRENTGSFTLVLERPFAPFPIHQMYPVNGVEILFNRGRTPVATWNNANMASSLKASEAGGTPGFVTFSSKFLTLNGRKLLNGQNGEDGEGVRFLPAVSPLVCIVSEKEDREGEWAHGNFPLEEYVKALDRSKGELHYNHSLGMQYSKITEQIYVGSCIQTEADVKKLSLAGITAVLNFQSNVEAQNWGINSNSINEFCQRHNILMINYPISDADSVSMRKKLPFCVGLLFRLLKKNHHVFVTCTNGFNRSPASVIAYLHWITDTSLHAAYTFVTGLHSCKPDRAAIACASWDLIAMVENGKHEGPATHAVTFIWNGHEGEDVKLVGDFTGNWKEPITARHKGGPRYEVEVRLSQGKYYYKYIVNGEWRHSTNSPTERDERGNINNVIIIGDKASVKPYLQAPKKDANIVKVIERPLTEKERFMLAKAARCIAFSICPIRLMPK